MKPRRQRMILVALVATGVVLSAGLALRAFQENLLYFFTPSRARLPRAKRRPIEPTTSVAWCWRTVSNAIRAASP